jgi:hypothetical protein
MTERKFGVEIEMHFRDLMGSRGSMAEKARILLSEGGFGHWFRGRNNTIGHDGSGIEIRTPPLAGADGFAELKACMDLLAANDGACNLQDGMHVHHDAPEFKDNIELLTRLVRSWVANRDKIVKFVAPNREVSGACSAWRPVDIEDIKYIGTPGKPTRMEEYTGGWGTQRQFVTRMVPVYFGRRDLNIASLERHGTVEIRLHEGTLDSKKAVAWVQFGQYFLDSILERQRTMRCSKDEKSFLKKIKLPKEAQEALLAAI